MTRRSSRPQTDVPTDTQVPSQLLFTVLEGVELGTWDWDLVTGREYLSPRLRAIYGYGDRDDLQFAAQLDALTHPDDRQQMQADREAHWRGVTPYYRNEHRVRHRDGHWIWVLTKGLVVTRDANGMPVRMVGIHVDISDRKHEELNHRETRERLELALNGANEGLWDWNLLTDQVYHSPRYMSLLGYSDARTFDGEYSFRGNLHPDDLVRVTRLVHASVEGQAPVFDAQYRLRCRNGHYRWFHGRGAIARDDRGVALRFAGHLADVTEKVEAEGARRELENKLREVQKQDAVGMLATGVARDFGDLVDTIRQQLDRLRVHCHGHEAAQQSIQAVEAAAVRAGQLAQAVQTLGRQQAQHMVLLDLGQLVASSLAELQATRFAAVRVSVQLPDMPACVLADAAQMGHVVTHLCDNACQAVVDNGGAVDVQVSLDTLQSGVTLTVRDSGVGMTQEVLSRVFEPFYSGQAAGKGGGLGLPVVSSIVRAHQGRVDIDSQLGQGTCVTVWLPAVRSGIDTPASQAASVKVSDPLVRDAPATNESEPSTLHTENAEAAAVRQRHVVYIDDYEAMVYLISRMLKKRGIRVSAFERAEDALALIESDPADVDMLVTDYNMPGISGLDVVRQVKQWRGNLPMVITSGHVTPGMTAEAKAEGVVQVLNKHDSVEDLAGALAGLLDRLPR